MFEKIPLVLVCTSEANYTLRVVTREIGKGFSHGKKIKKLTQLLS